MTSDGPWGDQPPRDTGEFVRGLWRVGREAADKNKQVVEAVRKAGHGKTRDQLRILFEDELARHEMPADPIWVERMLDELEWSSGERARQTAQRLWQAGGTLIRMAQSHGIPDAPQWMQPPEDASYRMWVPSREKTSVEIDPRADAWLERVLTNAPGRVGETLALIDVWFDWDADAEEAARVAVHIGVEMVGVLNPSATERFVPVMRSAGERDLKPRAGAQLAKAVHMQPPYLLVMKLPAPDAS